MEGELGPQMGADGGRWWQILGHGAKFGHKKEQAIAALFTHRNVGEAARAVTHPKNQRSNRSPFRQTSPKTTARTRGKPKNHTENRPKNR